MKSISRSLITGSVIAASSLLALSARAEGLYVGGNVGGSSMHGSNIGGSTSSTPSAYKLYGGYSFNPYFGLEAGYADLGRFNGTDGTLRARSLFLDAVGTYPLGNNFSAIGRVGVLDGRIGQNVTAGATPTSESGTGTGYKLGAGLQYDITKTIAVRGEWERYRFNAMDITPTTNTFTVGLNYHF